MIEQHENTPTPNRRRFVKGGLSSILAASAAPAILHTPRGYAEKQEGKKLGMAIIGLGGYADRSIAPEMHTCEHAELVAVVTGNPDTKGKAYQEKYGIAADAVYTYENFESIKDDERIDYVHVTLPNNMHAEYAIKAANAGKHVIVEKPMAISAAECEQMIAAAKKNNVLLAVNYRLHFEPHHMAAMKLLADGKVGQPTNGSYEFSWGYLRNLIDPERRKRTKQWLLDPVMTGGGALFDTGVYPIQAACYSQGSDPIAVRGLAETSHKDIFPEGVEQTMSFEMLFEDGFQAICRASYSASYHQYVTMGPGGVLEIHPEGRGSVFGQSAGGNPSLKSLVLNRKPIEKEQVLQQAVLHDAFAQAIKAGAKTFKTPGEMGLRDLRIMEAITQSAREGGVLVNL